MRMYFKNQELKKKNFLIPGRKFPDSPDFENLPDVMPYLGFLSIGR